MNKEIIGPQGNLVRVTQKCKQGNLVAIRLGAKT